MINAFEGNSKEKDDREHKEGNTNDDEYGSYYDYDYENDNDEDNEEDVEKDYEGYEDEDYEDEDYDEDEEYDDEDYDDEDYDDEDYDDDDDYKENEDYEEDKKYDEDKEYNKDDINPQSHFKHSKYDLHLCLHYVIILQPSSTIFINHLHRTLQKPTPSKHNQKKNYLFPSIFQEQLISLYEVYSCL